MTCWFPSMKIGTMSGKGSDSRIRREMPHLKYRIEFVGCWCMRPSGNICTQECFREGYAEGAGKLSRPFVE